MILKLIQMQFLDFYDIIFFSANIFFPWKEYSQEYVIFIPFWFSWVQQAYFLWNKIKCVSLSVYMIPYVLEFRLENRKYDSMRVLSSQYFMFRFLEKFLFISCGVTDTANIEVV